MAVVRLASRYGRYGYRRVTAMLQWEGWRVNHKRVERIWRRGGLKVPAKQPKRGRLWLTDGSCVRLRPQRRNHVWAYDLVALRTSDGKPVRLLTVVDEYTRECLAIHVGRSLRSPHIIECLGDLMVQRGVPEHLRSDNGPEFTARAVRLCGVRGDGFGMLSYANDTAVHARLAAEAVPEDPVIGLHGKEVISLASQVMAWAAEARGQAPLALMSSDMSRAQLLTANMLELLDKAFEGSQQTYRATQDMGQYTLRSVAGAEEPDPKPPSVGEPRISNIALASLLIGSFLLVSGAYIHWRGTGSRARTTWPV